jgi:hypothetical protein
MQEGSGNQLAAIPPPPRPPCPALPSPPPKHTPGIEEAKAVRKVLVEQMVKKPPKVRRHPG